MYKFNEIINGLKISVVIEDVRQRPSDDCPVAFPDDRPNTVVTDFGSCLMEAIAFATFRYCWARYRIEGMELVPFADIAEAVYNNSCKARSTLQNAVARGKGVNDIGVNYGYSGEYVYISYPKWKEASNAER